MGLLERIGVRVQPILLAVAMLSALPGCGEEQGDFDKASRGELKTPDQILKDAKEKEAKYNESIGKGGPPPVTKGAEAKGSTQPKTKAH
jgi:hypothetical protein